MTRTCAPRSRVARRCDRRRLDLGAPVLPIENLRAQMAPGLRFARPDPWSLELAATTRHGGRSPPGGVGGACRTPGSAGQGVVARRLGGRRVAEGDRAEQLQRRRDPQRPAQLALALEHAEEQRAEPGVLGGQQQDVITAIDASTVQYGAGHASGPLPSPVACLVGLASSARCRPADRRAAGRSPARRAGAASGTRHAARRQRDVPEAGGLVTFEDDEVPALGLAGARRPASEVDQLGRAPPAATGSAVERPGHAPPADDVGELGHGRPDRSVPGAELDEVLGHRPAVDDQRAALRRRARRRTAPATSASTALGLERLVVDEAVLAVALDRRTSARRRLPSTPNRLASRRPQARSSPTARCAGTGHDLVELLERLEPRRARRSGRRRPRPRRGRPSAPGGTPRPSALEHLVALATCA